MTIPRLVIAGTHSGCGKTSVAMGIMAVLRGRGLKVQPYKTGPDYIDPMFHTEVTGRVSRNLDSWMLPPETVGRLFSKSAADADIAVIEGVMGLYDGYGGRSIAGSTADVAKLTGAPVILVINGSAMSLSAAALVKGFLEFDPARAVKGVIINKLSGLGHYQLLKEVIEEHAGVPVLGYLRRSEEVALGGRHLGLVTSVEVADLKEKIARLAAEIQATVDLERLLRIAREGTGAETALGLPEIKPVGKARIAVAKDRAFCFYYQDNLDLLEALGAELAWVSPIADSGLPPDIDGLYIGGGYPELWAAELEGNRPMRTDIRRRIQNGLPTYAECGGLMYLGESLADHEGKTFEMVGALPGKSRMTPGLQRFGYVNVRVTADNILARQGQEIRAHEFHYSEMAAAAGLRCCFEVSKRREGTVVKSWPCGFTTVNLLAGYPHLHFWANPAFAEGFVRSCLWFRREKAGERR